MINTVDDRTRRGKSLLSIDTGHAGESLAGKGNSQAFSPLSPSKQRLRKDPSYLRPKQVIPPINKKVSVLPGMTPQEKQKAREESDVLEIERRLFLLRKMSEKEKIRLILRHSQDIREIGQLKLMVHLQSLDPDFLNQRAIRYIN